MRFPFVGRAIYDDAVERVKTAEARADHADARYESLVERMLAMKRSEGWQAMPVRTEPLKPSESALAPETEFAIEEMSTGDPTLRRYLSTYAQRETAKGTDASVIAHAIRYGDSGEEMENET